jgi:hypothetical protein
MLAAVALWIFSFFIGFASDLVAGALAPVKNPRDPEEMVANRRVADAASLASPREITTLAPVIPSGPTISRCEPAVLYSQATSTILDPCLRQA